MSRQTFASIIIPTFNRAEYLKEAIDSSLAQTMPCEIIVCDHGSTDHTPQVASGYGDKIKYIRKEKDLGIHFCWLDGIMQASHEWIHINYDDDWIHPDFMKECMALTDYRVGFVFTQANIVNQNTGATTLSFNLHNFETGIHPSRKAEWFLLNNVISPACVLIRKQHALNGLFIGEIPLAEATYRGVGPDILMSLMTLLDYEKFGYINKPLAFFRAHDGSITVDSLKRQDTQKKIDLAYKEARVFYVILKVIKSLKIRSLIFGSYIIYRKIINKILK